MATIQRPTKQGNATTYQGKVAAGYTKILASEVDADIDLIYSAWNQGVDTVNIADGSITGSKLAPGVVGSRELTDGGIQTVDIGDGQVTTPKIADGAVTAGKLVGGGVMGGDLSGSYPNPSLGVVHSGVVSLTARGQLSTASNTLDLLANSQGSPSYDNSKPSYMVRLDYTADQATLFRAPAGSPTTWAFPFYVKGSDGKTYCTLADKSVALGQLAIGAALQSIAVQQVTAHTPTLSEQVIVEAVWTSRGGQWLGIAVLQGVVAVASGSPAIGVSGNLRIDGTPGAADGTIAAGYAIPGTSVPSAVAVVPFSLAMAATGTGGTVGSHRMKATCWLTGQVLAVNTVQSGFLLVGEFA